MRDALLDPLTVERLKAVRKYVDSMDAEFPPEPLESDISGPIYGRVRDGNLKCGRGDTSCQRGDRRSLGHWGSGLV